MVRRFAPGPVIVRFLSMSNSPVVKVIVCPFSAGSKLIVPPTQTLTIALRNEPAPLSLVLVTVTGFAQGLIVITKVFGAEVSLPPLAVPLLSASVIVIVALPLALFAPV